MRSTFFTQEGRDCVESPPSQPSSLKSISARLRQWFPKPRRRLSKVVHETKATSPVNGDAAQQTTTPATATIKLVSESAKKTKKRRPVSTPVLSSNGYAKSAEPSPKRPHSMCVSLKALADDDGIPEVIPLSPITEEPTTAKPSPQPEDDARAFASCSSQASLYTDHSCQTEELPCLSSCSCSSQQPTRESTPSTPPLLTPTGPPPDNWRTWTEGGDLPEEVTSSLEKISRFQDKLDSHSAYDSDDEDELAFYRSHATKRPMSGLGAFLETMPSPDMDQGRIMQSPPSSPSPLRRGDLASEAYYSPERPRTRQRRDSLETPKAVWAPHQLSAIPEDAEWDCRPIRTSSDSDRNSYPPTTPSKTPASASTSALASTSPITPPTRRRRDGSNRNSKFEEYARVVQPTIIQSIAVYAGAFFRSQKLIDPDMRPEEIRDSLQTVLLAGIEDIIGSIPQEDMMQPLRQYFNPYVPDIAEAMVSGLGSPVV